MEILSILTIFVPKIFNVDNYSNECSTYHFIIYFHMANGENILIQQCNISSVTEIKFYDVPCDASL